QNIFHFEIGPMLAGLGVGALAFAFAAKDLLANLFGAVVLFSDRPFHLGDRIKIGGYQGYVEEVGFRATRVRTLEGHLLTVPNALLASETIENVSARPYIKRVLNVTVTYNTPPGKLHRGIEIIKEMCEARKEHFHPESPYRVFFSDFNADSLNIIVYYWFVPPDWWEYNEFNHEFNMELLRRYNEEGIEFAFPTQTLYVKPDAELAVRVASQDKTQS
ncbi:MAG: mechanosensitive ion channel family protein, partial [Phycisphaerae bacterium]|nr:mechanosensitive ion channel family protein [Phycisphaerae bacterium]